MILQQQRFLGRMRGVGTDLAVRHPPDHLFAVMHDDSVVDHGLIRGFDELVAFPSGRLKDDVVIVPLARFLDGCDERRPLAVDGTRLTIGVSGVVPGVENLDFIAALNDDA